MDAVDVVVIVTCGVMLADWLIAKIRSYRGQKVLFWYCPACRTVIPAENSGGFVLCHDQPGREEREPTQRRADGSD